MPMPNLVRSSPGNRVKVKGDAVPMHVRCALHEDRELAQFRVSAAVVEVQMRIGGKPQVSDLHSAGSQGFGQLHRAGPVVGVNLWVEAHSGVEQQRPCRVINDIAQAGFHPRSTGAGLLGRSHEVPEIGAPDSDVAHCAIVSDRRLTRPMLAAADLGVR
jgi:hypothetical protein